MYDPKRDSQIISLIRANGDYVTVEYLSKAMNLSASTVRRNLKDLEEKGKVKRTYGGVSYSQSENGLAPFSYRTQKNAPEKITVCRLGASLVKDGDVVFTDASSTAYCLTNFLKEFNNLTVISNGIETVNSLRTSTINVYSTGGKVSPTNKVALIGKQALDFINSVHADVTFVSAFGVDIDGRVYDVFDDEICLRQAMLKNSNKKVLMLDSEKYGKIAPFLLAETSVFDYVLCDKDRKNFFAKGVKINLITP